MEEARWIMLTPQPARFGRLQESDLELSISQFTPALYCDFEAAKKKKFVSSSAPTKPHYCSGSTLNPNCRYALNFNEICGKEVVQSGEEGLKHMVA
ncbi:hypothetical protein N7505_009165 [Penicillium chrysogenum]|uniref:Uncharacterized protein n=1 Tax=Penicillium chrysogenum TaxID=5076 RepID=A0ABQ8W9G0_PENCH|nr:hypothetical protein N7505_009165 [Penicillium chrysogenum]